MKIKRTTYDTVSLNVDEVRTLLIEALKLDNEYKLSISHAGDPLWDYKLEFALTKTTETK